MRNHGKTSSTASLPLALLTIMSICPVAVAQEMNQAKTKTATPSKPHGAASPSYAACAPGQPIGGIVVKGGQNPKGPKGKATVDTCADSTDKSISERGLRGEIAPVQPEAAARDTRTYTGGRRNEAAPAAAVAPATIKAVASPAAELNKKSSE